MGQRREPGPKPIDGEVDPDVAVLLTSGFSINDDVQALLDAGARGFMQKPFWKKEFSAVVAEALRAPEANEIPKEP